MARRFNRQNNEWKYRTMCDNFLPFSFTKGKSNEVNESLMKLINDDGRIHMVPSKSKEVYFLRLAVCASRSNSDDIKFAWDVILELVDGLLSDRKDTARKDKK